MTLTFSPLYPQTPAPSRTASFSESRTDEVAPAKKAKPAMPQGNSQRGFRTLCSFLRPRWASRGGRKQFGLCCGRGTWDGNGTWRCGGRSLLCKWGHSIPQLSSLPPPTGCVIWAGGLRRRRSYRSTRSGEGPSGPPPEQTAGAQSSGWQKTLVAAPTILGLTFLGAYRRGTRCLPSHLACPLVSPSSDSSET